MKKVQTRQAVETGENTVINLDTLLEKFRFFYKEQRDMFLMLVDKVLSENKKIESIKKIFNSMVEYGDMYTIEIGDFNHNQQFCIHSKTKGFIVEMYYSPAFKNCDLCFYFFDGNEPENGKFFAQLHGLRKFIHLKFSFSNNKLSLIMDGNYRPFDICKTIDTDALTIASIMLKKIADEFGPKQNGTS